MMSWPSNDERPVHDGREDNHSGNKNSHVYHLPGDKGSLPAPQNRVYFSSAAAAQAAGYHAAGNGHSMTSHSAMMHSTMVHH